MTPDEIVSRFTINARSNFVRLRAGMAITGAQLNGLKLRGVVVWQDFHCGWTCDPAIAEAFDRRWPKHPADKPHRVQLRRSAGWKLPANTVKVDRSTIYGNPFIVGKKTPEGAVIGNNRAAVDAFRLKVELRLQHQVAADPAFCQFTRERLRAALGGKNLACWCSLDEPCHADTLLYLAISK
jgi:hypothetical protein